jgi:tetratricopeptide (TPR) repeat protein
MQPPRSKGSSARGRSARAATPPLSRRRLWLFRLAAAVLGPVLLLLVLEAGLRLAGAGHPASFFLPMRINGKDCLIENARFGWRFFGPEMARSPFPLAIPRIKEPDTVRVFVFGESAAYGDPQPEFGLSRVLQALLEGRYPDHHFEVVNTGMTAINSHVIVPIARDCAAQHGDFWVVYMGNNEVVGPYGSGTVFGPQAANLALVRAGLAFKATRLGQELGGLVRHLQKRPVNQSEWGGMIMFLHNHVRQDDPRMAVVYASFERNLNDIIDYGRRSGAKIVVSTVARNLMDCGPFASEHRPGMSAQELSRWEGFYQAGIQAQQAGRTVETMDSFAQAAKMDDTFAEAHFRQGQCALALRQDGEALRQFTAACDQDVLRFRADSRINQIIRQAASNRERDGVRLVDAEAAMAGQSPHGITGGKYLYEHVHLNFEGNYLVALALAEQVAPGLAGNRARPWPTAEDCARRLGWTDSTRRAGEMDVLSRLNDPPFTQQVNHREQYQLLRRQVEQLLPATQPDALRQQAVLTKAAAAAATNDWILQENLAFLQQKTGDAAGEVESLQRVVGLLPHSPDAWRSLGVALEGAKRNEEAISAFQQAIRLNPDAVEAMNSLAMLYAQLGRNEEAAAEFQEVLRRKPYWGPAHLGLGKTLEAEGKPGEARKQFQESLVNRVSSPESFSALGKFSFGKGWYEAAATNFTDSLRLNPADPEVQVNLGLTLIKLGRRDEAKAHYAEAVRLDPKFAEAHFVLGLEMGKEGDAAGATGEFAEAVRLKPQLLEARLNLGIALFNQHRNPEALEQFQAVLQEHSTNPVALKYAGILGTNAPAPSGNQ